MINYQQLFTASTWVIPVITAVILHELAHGYVALRCGDDTALKKGRLSFNPIRHIDPVGTLALPLFLIIINSPFIYGFAKPVPVSLFRLKNPKRSMALVALAGPLINIALAFLAVLGLKIIANYGIVETLFTNWLILNIINFFAINLILASFNLFPLPPLDGSKVLAGILPNNLAIKMIMYEKQGMLILLALIFLPNFISNYIDMDINILGWYVNGLKKILSEFMFKGLNIL